VVTLTVRGNIVHIEPWTAALVPSCTGQRRVREVQRGRKAVLRYNKIPLYRLEAGKQGCGVCMAGLLSRMLRALERAHVPYELNDLRELPPEPDLSRLQPLKEMQPEVIAVMVSFHNGIIHCATAFGKSFLITQGCRIYPQIRILVTSSSASVVKSLYQRISEACDKKTVSICTGAHGFRPASKVCVCTAQSLHKIPADWPELLLFDEVHEAAAPGVFEQLVRFSGSRMFGFSASPSGRSDCADRLVEALFGPPVVKVTYEQAEEAGLVVPITVAMIGFKTNLKVNSDDTVVLKRRGYWQHAQRNHAIAAMASNLVSNRMQTLIFVETVEHALRLKQLLPEFTVVHAGLSAEDWRYWLSKGLVSEGQESELMSPNESEIRKRFASGELQYAISTTVWKQGVDFPRLNALIRADGQAGEIACTQIAGRLSRTSDGKSGAVLVDFEDDYGDWYRGRALTRRDSYCAKGWAIESLDV
jgi:superfamily II DNA or RNA helicase